MYQVCLQFYNLITEPINKNWEISGAKVGYWIRPEDFSCVWTLNILYTIKSDTLYLCFINNSWTLENTPQTQLRIFIKRTLMGKNFIVNFVLLKNERGLEQWYYFDA